MSFGGPEMAILAADAFAFGRKWGELEQRTATVAGEFDYKQLAYRLLDDVPLVAAWDVRIAVSGGETYRVIVGCNAHGRYGTLCWEVHRLEPEQAEARS